MSEINVVETAPVEPDAAEQLVYAAHPKVRKGMVIGRFVVVGQIGKGGMGTVYEAYDPQLSRSIAIKLVTVRSRDADSPGTIRDRLLREAKALAQLSHPNVVTIYDVGTYGEDVFLALELVKGETLRRWLRRERRPRHEIISVFCDAGRGLDAAHRTGIVHRDFKPGNVVLGNDGRVRVLDFGLACVAAADPSDLDDSLGPTVNDSETTAVDTPSHPAWLGSKLTRVGHALGTPVYMSPEQHLGRPMDGKSDQFSFCVALYEALYGARPFMGSTAEELRTNVLELRFDTPPADANVPRWLRAILLRGMARDPADRFPTMSALVRALADNPNTRRNRRLAKLGFVSMVVGSVATGAWLGQKPTPCTGGATHTQSLWNEQRASKLEEVFSTSKHFGAAQAARRVDTAMTDFVGKWNDAYLDACEATHVRGEQSTAALEHRMTCLVRKRDQMRSLVELLGAEPSRELIEGAVTGIIGLGDLRDCGPGAAENADVVEDPVARTISAQVDADLDRAEVLQIAGQYEEALALLGQAVDASEGAQLPSRHASAMRSRGNIAAALGRWDEAQDDLRASMELAGRAKSPMLLTRAGLDLMYVSGYHQTQYDAAAELGVAVRATMSMVDDPSMLQIDYARSMGAILLVKGDLDGALRHFEDELAYTQAALGPSHLFIASALNNMASALLQRDDFRPALRHVKQAIKITTSHLGPNHPSVALMMKNVSVGYDSMGDLIAAEQSIRDAIAIESKIYRSDHPALAQSHYILAGVVRQQERNDEAIGHYRWAVQTYEKLLGPTHPRMAGRLNGLGAALVQADQLDAAAPILERAHTVALDKLGQEHMTTGHVLSSLALLAHKQGDRARAYALYEQAKAIASKNNGPQSPWVARLCAKQAPVAPSDEHAIALWTRAEAIHETHTNDDRSAAHARFGLAQVLWATEPVRSRQLAQRANLYYQANPHPWLADERTEVLAWLEAHSPT